MANIGKEIKLWISVIRPHTLFASFCPVVAGALLYVKKTENILAFTVFFFITLICALSLQILSNLINDWYDYKKGLDKKGRAGFKRVLAEGEVTPQQMKKAIYIILLTVILSGAVLVVKGGLPILLIGITAILFAWLYTATRFSLSYLGIADIFCFLYYGVLAVVGTAYILNVDGFAFGLSKSYSVVSNVIYDKSLWCAGGICGLISMTVLMINNLRDTEDDRKVNKKTLPVRFGKKTGEIMLLCYALAELVLSFVAFGLSFTNLIFIFSFMLYQQVCQSQGRQYNECLVKAGKMNLFFVILLVLEVFL